MSKFRKVLALFLACAMIFGLAACTGTTTGGESGDEAESTPIVVGYSPFSSKFSPFFEETAYDRDAWEMVHLYLLSSDRQGAIVYNGIKGETIPYNGTDYTYYGPADLKVTENSDGTVDYDFTLREDLVFSDGTPMTIDDVIFSFYVLCDPTYDGSATLFATPITGLAAYRSGMDTLFNLLVKAGEANTDFTFWDEATQQAFWADLNQAGEAFAQEIVDYCVDAGYAADSSDVAGASAAWGFSGESTTAAEFFAEMCERYEWDLADLSSTESAGSSLTDLMEDYAAYTIGVKTGESAPNIAGIKKTGEYSMTVSMDQVDATAIYRLAAAIAPLHYYGDKALYDYDNNSFGFPKGDLSIVRSKTTQPLGAGPYKFIKFENGVIYYEANENYYKGVPQTKFINFLECTADDDKLNGILTGTIDISDPTFSTDNIAAIEKANGGNISGDKIYTSTVDNLGYGYIGINSKNVCVGGDNGSEASKALRKAFATIFAVYRDVAVDSYYGDRASVINYPISNTSWAAPQSTDDGYKLAFSVDVEGKDIYTSDMAAEDKYAAAKTAALGFFEAAGYSVEGGMVTAAPEGASTEYEIWIPADGTGDHPSFMILTEARDALADIGINLVIRDLTNSSDLWTGLSAEEVPMWCAAWQADLDPDMYQIYFSGSGDMAPGGSNYQYGIDDAELNQLILDARRSTDQTYRKAMYKACLDIIIDWAVEIPVYQRQNAITFSAERLNLDTVTPDITTFYDWMLEVEKLALK